MQFVMPSSVGDASAAPRPNEGSGVDVRQEPGGVFAARRFAGIATDELAKQEEEKLAKSLAADGLARDAGAPASLAQYNDPLTNPVQRRNDVLIKLESFDAGRLDK